MISFQSSTEKENPFEITFSRGESRDDPTVSENKELKTGFFEIVYRQHQHVDTEDEIERKARRLDAMLKYPLIVIMISYLIAHFTRI